MFKNLHITYFLNFYLGNKILIFGAFDALLWYDAVWCNPSSNRLSTRGLHQLPVKFPIKSKYGCTGAKLCPDYILHVTKQRWGTECLTFLSSCSTGTPFGQLCRGAVGGHKESDYKTASVKSDILKQTCILSGGWHFPLVTGEGEVSLLHRRRPAQWHALTEFPDDYWSFGSTHLTCEGFLNEGFFRGSLGRFHLITHVFFPLSLFALPLVATQFGHKDENSVGRKHQ